MALAPRSWIPAVAFALGTAVTALTAAQLRYADHERHEMQLAGLANGFGTLLQMHLAGCEEALRAAAMVAGAGAAPDAARWQTLRRQVRAGEPGSCIDTLVYLPAPGTTAVAPLVATPGNVPMPALEHFDPWQDPTHRPVLEATRSHGQPRLAIDARWPGAPGGTRTLVWYAPVFRQGAVPSPAGDQEAALLGHVGVSIRLDEVHRALIGQFPDARLDIDVHSAAGELAHAHQEVSPPGHTDLRERTLRIGGSWWHLRAGLADDHPHEAGLPPWLMIFGVGTLLTGMMTWLTRRILSQSADAHRMARHFKVEVHDRERRLHSVLDGVRDGVVTLDVAGRIIGANRAAEQMLGYPEERLIAQPATMLRPEARSDEYRALWIEHLAKARASRDGHTPVMELDVLHKDGRILPTRSSFTLVRAAGEELVVWIINDLTREREMERRVSEAAALNQAIMDAAPIGMMTIGADNRITSANPAIHAMSGHSSGELVGQRAEVLGDFDEAGLRVASHGMLPAPADACAPAEDDSVAGIAMETEWAYLRKDGSRFPAGVIAVPLRRPTGEMLGELRMVMDITERKRAAARIQHMALHDSLTGLPNRVLLQARAGQCLLRAHDQQSNFALALIDLDHFKQINDSLGHAIGDEVLKVVAQRLAHAVRASDTVVRMGGDEFALLLPDVHDDEALAGITRKVLAAMAEVMIINDHRLHITASMGVSMYPDHGTDLLQLLKHADAAMYDTKAHGRAGVSIYDERMSVQTADMLELQADLSQALARNEFVLFYQPVVDAATGAVTALEALLRWKHPQRGLVPPLDFIPLAEDTGLIVAIGAWALRQACSDLALLRRQQRAPLRIAVNLSARQFRADGLVDHVREALDVAGLDGTALELEITESVLMTKVERTQSILAELRQMGVRIAIDDFGTGYSSLSYLTNFPVQTVKIDRSFVREITTSESAALLTGAIVAMAHSLNLDIVAEGVETAEQQRHLAALGCELLQGYRFGRPAPVEQLHDAFARARLLQLQALADPQNILA